MFEKQFAKVIKKCLLLFKIEVFCFNCFIFHLAVLIALFCYVVNNE